jgi:hypothetical protein
MSPIGKPDDKPDRSHTFQTLEEVCRAQFPRIYCYYPSPDRLAETRSLAETKKLAKIFATTKPPATPERSDETATNSATASCYPPGQQGLPAEQASIDMLQQHGVSGIHSGTTAETAQYHELRQAGRRPAEYPDAADHRGPRRNTHRCHAWLVASKRRPGACQLLPRHPRSPTAHAQ